MFLKLKLSVYKMGSYLSMIVIQTLFLIVFHDFMLKLLLQI